MENTIVNEAGQELGFNPAQSLAEYRAQRDGTAAAAPPVKQEITPPAAAAPGSGDELDDDDAGEGDANSQEQGGEPAAADKPRRKGGFQKTIERLNAENEELKRKLAGTPAAAAAGESKAADDAPAFDKPKPKIEDFETLAEHTEALTDWKLEEREWKRGWADAKAAHEAESAELTKRWTDGVAAAKADKSDYDEVLAAVDDVKLSADHQRLFLKSPYGAELAYIVASDRALAESLAAMSPEEAAVEIGVLEAPLRAAAKAAAGAGDAPQPKTKKVSAAPPPLRQLAGGRTAPGTPDIKTMSAADYRRAREAGTLR